MSRRNHSPKTRPFLALLIVATTVFLLLGASAGVLGALCFDVATRLLGAAGTGLLCGTAWCIAFILATPPGTLTRMVVAIWRHSVARRHTPSVVLMRPKATEPPRLRDTPEYAEFQAAKRALLAVEPAAPALSVNHRRALDDVRTALKGLGYLKHEIEPVVATLDPNLPLENILRTAIKSLQVN
jgi:hypothetical protein